MAESSAEKTAAMMADCSAVQLVASMAGRWVDSKADETADAMAGNSVEKMALMWAENSAASMAYD